MITEELERFINNFNGNDTNSNQYCNLRFYGKYQEERILQNIMNTKILRDKVHLSYFPRTLGNICKREVKYYINVDNSINELMSWGTELVNTFSEDACKYINLKNQYENALFSEKYDLALKILDNIEKKICCSVWSTYQKFLILNFLNKQVEVEGLIDKLQNRMQNSLVFLLIFYYAKMANCTIGFDEYNTNLDRFLDTGDRTNIDWKYLNFKLNLTVPKDIQGIKSALILDEQISFIDYYETYIETLQALSGNDRYVSLIKDCVLSLYPKNKDFRLRNIYISLIKVDDKVKLDEEACNIIENYTLGKYDEVKRKVMDYIKIHSSNFEICNLFMKIGIENNQIDISHSEFWHEINNIYLFNYNTRNSISIIGSYYKLFYGTSWKYKILSIMVRKLNYKFDSNILRNSILNDSICTPLFYHCIKSNKEQLPYLMKFKNNAPITTQLLSYMITGEIDNKTVLKIDTIRWKYYEIQSLIKRKDFSESIRKCCQILDNSNEIKSKSYYQERIRRTLYNSYLAVDEIENAMNLYVDSFLIIEELVAHMNLTELIKMLDDDNDDYIKGNICRPIVFTLYFKTTIDEILPAYLDYIENKGCETIKQIIQKYDHIDEKDVLFLNKVCTQSLLMKDYVSKSKFGGSAAELRAEVLRVLIDLDKKNDRIKEYMSELNSIYKATQLQKKINSFNHNRIFIDTENLYLYMSKDLEDEFIKYKTVQEVRSIVSTKKGKNEDYERILAFVSEQYWDQQRFFISMAEKIKKEYLNESPFALENFLSTRIRHNFCNDNLKKAFEAEKLFSKKMKDDSADYIINDYWKNKLPEEEYSVIIDALSRFSQSIDSKIQEIKDKWMRIKKDESSEGIFDYIGFTKYLTSYYIFSETLFNDVAGFFDFIISQLDCLTGEILEEIRDKIDKDLKPYYKKSLEQLENRIRMSEFDSLVKSEMIRCIELSKAKYIEDIEAFKDIFNMEHEKYPDFTMEELIEFCYEIENDMNSQFLNVKVETNIRDEGVYCGSIFPYLVDIIGILIRNAVEHSKIAKMDELCLGINIIPYQGSKIQENLKGKQSDMNANSNNNVVFTVSNNVSSLVDENTIRSKVSEKINNIYLGKFKDKSSQEGGSGLYKTARTIYYSLKSEFEYYYEVEDGVFEISISADLNPYLRKDSKD